MAFHFLKSIVIYRQLLQGQAKLVLEENAVLMEQLKIQETKAKENHNQHAEEGKISQLLLSVATLKVTRNVTSMPNMTCKPFSEWEVLLMNLIANSIVRDFILICNT